MSYSLLIVDDSKTIRQVLSDTFEMTKLPRDHILEAGDGLDALDILDKEWVDMIFCDINIPRMNGLEFLKRVKEHPEFQKIPLVIVSTEGSTTRIKELKDLGVAGYLRKPCRPEELRDAIYENLGAWE